MSGECRTCGRLPPHEGCVAICAACAPPNGTCTCAACALVANVVKECDALKAENVTLKVEVERLRAERDSYITTANDLVRASAKAVNDLKAEVERLRDLVRQRLAQAESDGTHDDWVFEAREALEGK